eukprot:scaffold46489_cov54-Phaeocystis_antarctica.AAC.3
MHSLSSYVPITASTHTPLARRAAAPASRPASPAAVATESPHLASPVHVLPREKRRKCISAAVPSSVA